MSKTQKRIIVVIIVIVIGIPACFLVYKFLRFVEIEKKYVLLSDDSVPEIVLVNIGDGDRAYIANLLSKVTRCEPAVAGLNALFEKCDETSPVDSLLLAGIRSSGSIVQAKHQGIGFYGAHRLVMEAASGYGFNDFITNDEGFISAFYLYRPRNGNTNYSMAYALAERYAPEKAKAYMEKGISQPQSLLITSIEENFKIYEFNELDFDCATMKDKIVILGYLGPGEGDKLITYARYFDGAHHGKNPDRYATLLVANEVLMILTGIATSE